MNGNASKLNKNRQFMTALSYPAHTVTRYSTAYRFATRRNHLSIQNSFFDYPSEKTVSIFPISALKESYLSTNVQTFVFMKIIDISFREYAIKISSRALCLETCDCFECNLY